jgi:ATP diphosphatase
MSSMPELLAIMAKLRDPQGGCPWDLEQDFASIAPYTIEEAYEVADAIQRGNLNDLREELGDLLLQVVFHSRMAEEQGAFDFEAVVRGIADKMVRRHPHVFADAKVADAAEQTRAWERLKQAEKPRQDPSVLADVARGLPEWQRAPKLQKRAASIGFDWPDVHAVLAKLEEEVGELRREIAQAAPRERIEDELGDVLFVIANIARHLEVDTGNALRRANAKFERRFRRMEDLARHAGKDLAEHDFHAQDALWEAAKAEDHQGLLGAMGERRE